VLHLRRGLPVLSHSAAPPVAWRVRFLVTLVAGVAAHGGATGRVRRGHSATEGRYRLARRTRTTAEGGGVERHPATPDFMSSSLIWHRSLSHSLPVHYTGHRPRVGLEGALPRRSADGRRTRSQPWEGACGRQAASHLPGSVPKWKAASCAPAEGLASATARTRFTYDDGHTSLMVVVMVGGGFCRCLTPRTVRRLP